MKLGRKFQIALAIASMMALIMATISLAYVTTDQQDYAPGSVVTISGDNSDGAGYLPYETVHVDVTGPNGYTSSCEGAANAEGAWSCQVTLWGDVRAVGEYTYTSVGLLSNVSQSGTFTDANLNLLGKDGNQHQKSTNEEDLGNVDIGNDLSLACPRGTGLSLKAGGLGGSDSLSWSISYVSNYGNDSTLSLISTINPSSGALTSSSGTACLALSIRTNGLIVGTTYHGQLRATDTSTVNVNADYFFRFTVTSSCIAASTTTQPASAEKTIGDSVTFSVTASGTAPLSYQWRKGGVNISGANSNSYTISSVVISDAGNYDVIVTGQCGSPATSTAAVLSVIKAKATILVTPYSVAYDGNAHTATGTATGLGGVNLSGLLNLSGTTHTNASDYAADAWSFAGNDNYSSANGTVHDIINKAMPLVSWSNPGDIVYGTVLGAAQLNATANVLGSFTYTPASGTALSAGDNQSLRADFTPADTTNYNTASKIVSINVLKATPVISVNGGAFAYDGNAHAAMATATGIGGATVSGNFSFTYNGSSTVPKNAGTYAVVATFISSNVNYNDAVGNGTITITPLAITGSITASNKVYNGNTTATISSRTLAGVVTGDVVSYGGGTASFSDKNVGNGKIITAIGLSLSGTDSGNYTVNDTATTTADITPRSLVVSATGENKVYDGNTNATVTLSDDRVSGDSLLASYTSASFGNKNVGTGKTVSVSGISISGEDAGNYTFNDTANTTADITAKALTISAMGVNKIYDGITNAEVNLSDDRVAGDVFTDSYTTASFADKNVGTDKTVSVSGISISGTDAGNYTLNTITSTTADITARALTVSATSVNKVYDGTTAVTITLSDDRITGDVFTVSYTSANFADKNVGTAKLVSVSGISISGTDAGNYTVNSTTTTTANIIARPITVTADSREKILGAADPALTYQVTSGSLVTGDTFSGALTRVAGEGVGTYFILQGTLTAGSNYDLDYVEADLTIKYAGEGTWCYGAPGHVILQPINADGTSVFKQKSTVPAKFRVCDANGNSIGTPGVVAKFQLVQTSNGTVTVIDETVDSTTPDIAFRWSPSDQLWIFNISTKNITANKTYTYLITLNDGSTIQFRFGLK